jgi:hypothetical protein
MTHLTLTQLLDIERTLIAPEDEFGLAYAELVWKNEGTPEEPPALCRALEHILRA